MLVTTGLTGSGNGHQGRVSGLPVRLLQHHRGQLHDLGEHRLASQPTGQSAILYSLYFHSQIKSWFTISLSILMVMFNLKSFKCSCWMKPLTLIYSRKRVFNFSILITFFQQKLELFFSFLLQAYLGSASIMLKFTELTFNKQNFWCILIRFYSILHHYLSRADSATTALLSLSSSWGSSLTAQSSSSSRSHIICRQACTRGPILPPTTFLTWQKYLALWHKNI